MNQTIPLDTVLAGATPIKTRKPPFASRKAVLAVSAAVLLAAGGAAWIAAPKASESTDAAYLEADSSVVAPKVRGLQIGRVGRFRRLGRGDIDGAADGEQHRRSDRQQGLARRHRGLARLEGRGARDGGVHGDGLVHDGRPSRPRRCFSARLE